MPDIIASFLLPTRGRPDRLVQSIQSIHTRNGSIKRWDDTDIPNYEILIRADVDDKPTCDLVKPWVNDIYCRVTLGPRHRGYLDLHLMVNQLAVRARGEFLVLWNDDALMQTENWDDVLKRHLADPPRIYHPTSAGTNRNIFPIVRRSIYGAMGRFSESALNDFYVWTLAKRLGINTHIDIDIKHDHPQVGGTNIDQTYLDAAAACGIVKHDDKDPRILACLAEDEAKIRTLLNR